MKSVFILLFTIPFFSVIMEKDTHPIIGKWVDVDNDEIGYLIFDRHGFAIMELNGQVLGGRAFIYNGIMAKMTYEINDLKNPIQLDLIVTILKSEEEYRLFCLLEFIDDDTMKLATNFNDKRPKDFKSETSVILKRVK